MPDAKKYDMDFRPSSYWAPENALEAILLNIHGEARRRALRKLLQRGEVSALQTFLAKNQIDDDERRRFARIHPQLMGGDYLPDDEDGETEIARVALESTTADVISVRAREVDGGYHYRIVDEYETVFGLCQDSSREPLTMGELIALIDSADRDWGANGLTSSIRDYNKEAFPDSKCEPGSEAREYVESLVDFVTVTSAFYPQLEAYYKAEASEWLKAVIEELDELEEADDFEEVDDLADVDSP